MFETYRNNGEFRLGEVRNSVGYLTADTWQKEIRIQICVAMDGGWQARWLVYESHQTQPILCCFFLCTVPAFWTNRFWCLILYFYENQVL